jgi:hypothetical protein
LTVRPSARQGDLKELACDLFGPVSLSHVIEVMNAPMDMHGRRVPSWDVWLLLVQSGAVLGRRDSL